MTKRSPAHMTLDDLHQHPLFREVIDDSIEVHKKLGLNLTDDFDENTVPDELQFYLTRVGFALSHTLTWVEQLHHGVHFMADFRYSKKVADAGVRKSHHLLYNVENYLIRIVSVYDRCLHLTNAIFHLCISEELVNHNVIVSNLHVARTDVPVHLKSVRQSIKNKEQERHKLIHRHSHMDPELRRIELLYMHTKASWPQESKSTFENMVRVRAQMVQKYTDRCKQEFETINDALMEALVPLFNILLIEYQRQKTRLNKLV